MLRSSKPCLRREFEPALDHALGLLANSGPAMRVGSLAIADVLLRHAAIRSWPTLRTAMESDDEFAREALLRVAAHFSFDRPFYRGLGERDIAALYLLMARLFPGTTRPNARRALSEPGTRSAISATGFRATWQT